MDVLSNIMNGVLDTIAWFADLEAQMIDRMSDEEIKRKFYFHGYDVCDLRKFAKDAHEYKERRKNLTDEEKKW